MAKTILQIECLSKSYGTIHALRDINLDVFDGEFLSLIGPSGSGKSTLLKIIAGVEAPSTGQVLYQGKDLQLSPPEGRDVVMVWQSLALFPHMDVEGNIAFGLAVRGIEKGERRKRVEEALRMVGLSGYQRRRVHELSGGEQQRVALARALVVEPKVLLLDEPFGALDAHLRGQLQAELRQLHMRTKLTFLMVTHDQAEAMALSNRVAVINRGQIEQVGMPKEIAERPRTPFVARFVGRKNVLDGQLLKIGKNKYLVQTEAGVFQTKKALTDTRKGMIEGATVAYVLEPTRIHLGVDTDNTVTGQVVAIVTRDHMEQIQIALPGGGILLWERIGHFSESSEIPLESGIEVGWSAQDAYVIPAVPSELSA